MSMVAPNTANTNKPKPEEGKKRKNLDYKTYLLYAAVVVLIIVALKIYLNSGKKGHYFTNRQNTLVKKLNKFSLTKKIVSALSFQKNTSLSQKKLKSQNLILNGILISPEKRIALINNIIVKEGDAIGDVIVLQINAEYVELGNSTLKFKLTPYKK